MLEKCARFTCYLHEKSQQINFCGPGRLKSLASWTRRPSEQSGTRRLSDDGNVVETSCRGCDDTNKKCSLLMERCAFEYQPELGCRFCYRCRLNQKLLPHQIFVSCKMYFCTRRKYSEERTLHCIFTVRWWINEFRFHTSCSEGESSEDQSVGFRKWNLVFNFVDCGTWLQSFWFLKKPKLFNGR